jgi:hypothetical protein
MTEESSILEKPKVDQIDQKYQAFLSEKELFKNTFN